MLLPLALVLLTGCPPRPRPEPLAPPAPPALLPVDEAAAAVNGNIAGITRSLASGRIGVDAVFHDEDGRPHQYRDLRGVLRFFPPHYLYLEVGAAVEPNAVQVGSNDRLFWVALKPKRNDLWWGLWSDLRPGEDFELPLAPDMVLAAMGLSRLPGPGEGLRGPVPRVDEQGNYRLLYLASSGGALWIQREYRLDRFPPYLPLEVTFRMPDGTVRMISSLDRYEPVGDSSVYVARQVRMYWPRTDDTLSMQIRAIRFDPAFGPGAPAYQLNDRRTTIPRSRWIRVGNEPSHARPAGTPVLETRPVPGTPATPADGAAGAAATSEPAMSKPAATEPATGEAPPDEQAAASEAAVGSPARMPEPREQPGQEAPASEPACPLQ